MTLSKSGIRAPESFVRPGNQRRHGRIRVQGFRSTLGEIVEVSVSGIRVRTNGLLRIPAGELAKVTIETPVGPVEADMRVVWAHRAGWLRHEAGLEFVRPTPELRAALAEMVKAGNQTP